MKKVSIGLALILLSGCAKPTVVKTYEEGDSAKTCKQLRTAYYQAHDYRIAAENEKGWRGDNIGRWLLFFPAALTTNSNANMAIEAAERRMEHLKTIMEDKGCKKY